MANGNSKASNIAVWSTLGIALIAALASVTSALIARSVSDKQQSIDEAVRSLGVSAQGRQIEADLAKRREDLLTTQLPRLLSPDPAERSQAREILVALAPTDLAGVVDRVLKVLEPTSEGSADATSLLAQRDLQLLEQVSNAASGAADSQWAIVVGSYGKSEAQHKARDLGNEGFTPAAVFNRSGAYSVAVTGFLSESTAEGVLVGVRAIGHPGAVVVDFNQWCPTLTKMCSPKSSVDNGH
jgi:hypothetical protein